MTSTKNVIKINPSDELATVIDRVLTYDSDKVSLLVSDDAYIAQNILNFRLLKREVESVGKKVVIITENPRIQTLASKAGLQVQERAEYATVRTKTQDSGGGTRPEHAPRREVTDILPPQSSRSENSSAPNILRGISSREHDEKPKPEPEFKPVPMHKPKEEILSDAKNHATHRGTRKTILGLFMFPVTFLFRGVEKIWKFARSTAAKNPSRALVLLLFVGIFGGFLFFAFGVLPRATIVLYPQTIQDNIKFSLIADAGISDADYSKGIIPAQIMEERQENNFTYEAKGEAQIEERARGKIKVFNNNSSPQPLVQNTRLLSANNKQFRTTKTVVVPAKSSLLVDVFAEEAGEEYNINPTTFSLPALSGLPQYTLVYGESEQKMEGGFLGRANIVTEEGLENARKKINEEFVPQAEDALKKRIPKNLKVLEGSFETRAESIEFSAKAGDRAETFGARVVVISAAFLVQPDDISGAITDYFINSTQYSSNFELSDERRIRYNVKEIDFEKGYAEFALDIEQIFNRRVDSALIVGEIKGQNEVEVRRILSDKDELKKSQIRFWPFWVNKVPADEEDITVEIQYEPSLQLD